MPNDVTEEEISAKCTRISRAVWSKLNKVKVVPEQVMLSRQSFVQGHTYHKKENIYQEC